MKIDWIAHGIVIIDTGEPHIRYLDSNFLRGTGISAEVEAKVRVLFDEFGAVHLELVPQNNRWKATVKLDLGYRVVTREGEGESLVEALDALMQD